MPAPKIPKNSCNSEEIINYESLSSYKSMLSAATVAGKPQCMMFAIRVDITGDVLYN